MSPAQDPSREDRDALLTASALGMVSPEERADVERLLAAPDAAAARAHVAEVRVTAAALKTARVSEMPERSADLRRAVLAAALGPGGGDTKHGGPAAALETAGGVRAGPRVVCSPGGRDGRDVRKAIASGSASDGGLFV